MQSRTLLALAAIAVLECQPSLAVETADPDAIEGYWRGWAERDGVTSDVAIRIRTQEAKYVGTADWPSMGYFRTDLLGVKVDGAQIELSVPLPVGALHLLGALGPDRITGVLDVIGLVKGEWKSLGQRGHFELVRDGEPAVPYAIESVGFRNGTVKLAGSIFLPQRKGKHTAVIYIAGSGDSTRGDGSFLADRLAREGIATLVYDKRGAGDSSGDWRSGGFEELADDAIAGLELLRARPDIDDSKIGIVCQSQGCWVAPVALRRGARTRFLVAQSGPAVSVADEDLDYYRVTLSAQQFHSTDLEEAFTLIRTDQSVSRGDASWSDLQARMSQYGDRAWYQSLGYTPEPLDSRERIFVKHTIDYDPAADIDAIRIPSLWIYGCTDTIIPVQASLARIHEAASQPKPEVTVLRGAGHSFTVEDRGLPRLAVGYPDVVVRWIRATTARS